MPDENHDPLLELTFDSLCVLSADGRFHGANKNLRDTLGFTLDELGKTNFLSILHLDDVTSTVGALQLLKAGSKTVEFEARINSAKGYIWMLWRCHVRDPQEGKIYTAASNIDKAKRLEIDLYNIRNFDERTGLLNRDKFFEQLDQLTEDSRTELAPFSLVMVGLEEIRTVNETFGSRVGDLLLKSFAERLQKNAESGMPVSRFAGDQFAIVVPAAEFEVVVKKVDALLRSLTETYELDDKGLRCTIGVSIGIETVINAHHSTSVLVRNADMALQVARTQPGNSRYRWFSQVESDALAAIQPAALRQSA